LTVVVKGSSIKGTVYPKSVIDQEINDKKMAAMRSELHKVSDTKPQKATYTPKVK